MRKKNWLAVPAMLLCLSLLGCAGTGPRAHDTAEGPEELLKAADSELEKGQRDKAIATLHQAAKEHPTDASPWLKLGNIWFEAENYPSAILAANEVLQRDPANQEAKSLLVVAGLRVAAGAVAGLRPSGQVGTNVRQEAENLTNSLREVLGEKVLVPAPGVAAATAESKSVVTSARPKARVVKPQSDAREVPPPRPRTAIGGDPFKSLK